MKVSKDYQAFMELRKRDIKKSGTLLDFIFLLLPARKTANEEMSVNELWRYFIHCTGIEVTYSEFVGALEWLNVPLYEYSDNNLYAGIHSQCPILKLKRGEQLRGGNYRIYQGYNLFGACIFDPSFFHEPDSQEMRWYDFATIWETRPKIWKPTIPDTPQGGE